MAGYRGIGPNEAVKAINSLNESEGATSRKITKYLQNNLKDGLNITENDVALALKKAIDRGLVSAKGGRYHTCHIGDDALDGRRRRRRSRSRRRRSRSRRRRSRRRGRRSRSRGRRRSSRRR